MPTVLERLPNEIFHEILSYLNGVDAFICFSGLNKRFRSLVSQYCTTADFKSIDKTQFDRFFRQNNAQQWRSLRMADDEDTPGQIQYFIRKYASLNCFSQLKSLYLLNNAPLDSVSVTALAPIFSNLVSLTISDLISDATSSLTFPHLKHLVFTHNVFSNLWFQDLPTLETLEYRSRVSTYLGNPTQWPPNLKRLKLVLRHDGDSDGLANSLRTLSRLETLEVYYYQSSHYHWPSGHTWQTLISSSLPLLKNFRFYFRFKYDPRYRNRNANEIERTIASFSTPFYVIEKGWYIRCDIKKNSSDKADVVLYSLPFAFDRLAIVAKYFDESLTTLPRDHNDKRYQNIYSSVNSLMFNNAPMYNSHFNRAEVTKLTLNCFVDLTPWLPIMTNLRSLTIHPSMRMWSKNFAHLLDNTPHLRSLTIDKALLRGVTHDWTDPHICRLLSSRIHSLTLRSRRSALSKSEVPHIVRIFAANCQHLSIDFTLTMPVVCYILQHMPRLRTLTGSAHSQEMWTQRAFYTRLKQLKGSCSPSNTLVTILRRNRFELRKYSDYEICLGIPSK